MKEITPVKEFEHVIIHLAIQHLTYCANGGDINKVATSLYKTKILSEPNKTKNETIRGSLLDKPWCNTTAIYSAFQSEF